MLAQAPSLLLLAAAEQSTQSAIPLPKMPIHTGTPHAAADGDNDNDDDGGGGGNAAASAAASATPAVPSTGRHAATNELEGIRLRQKIDTQVRNTKNNLKEEIISLDKKTVRALREGDAVRREAAAQKEGAAVAAEEARTAYETNLKQLQAAANINDKVTGLDANITELQRMISRANAAARAANKENAASSLSLRRRGDEAHSGRGGVPRLAGADRAGDQGALGPQPEGHQEAAKAGGTALSRK
eukprot:6180385-Pleurochrysis_carterae.AAC.1